MAVVPSEGNGQFAGSHGSRRIRSVPSLRQRTAGHWRPSASMIVVHSQVARPSRPLKLHVISKMPGAFTTAFARRLRGHEGGTLVSTKCSLAV